MASRLFYCPCEECSDEAISVGLVRMEIVPRPDKSGLAMTSSICLCEADADSRSNLGGAGEAGMNPSKQ